MTNLLVKIPSRPSDLLCSMLEIRFILSTHGYRGHSVVIATLPHNSIKVCYYLLQGHPSLQEQDCFAFALCCLFRCLPRRTANATQHLQLKELGQDAYGLLSTRELIIQIFFSSSIVY
ncbi:hypothetical protein ACJX0J_034519, partial [Zea mays]